MVAVLLTGSQADVLHWAELLGSRTGREIPPCGVPGLDMGLEEGCWLQVGTSCRLPLHRQHFGRARDVQPGMEARPPSLVGFGERSAGASHSPGCCFVGTEEQDEDGEEPKTGGCCLMAVGLFPVLPVPC